MYLNPWSIPTSTNTFYKNIELIEYVGTSQI